MKFCGCKSIQRTFYCSPLGAGLVITIIGMSMIVYPAKTIIKNMSRYNENDRRNEQPCFVMDKKKFQD